MEIVWKDGYIGISILLEIYNMDVLHKCFYWYAEDFSVDIAIENDNAAVVKLFPKTHKLDADLFHRIEDKIRTDLLDFKTRDIVTKETKNVRDLLIAKAFAHSDEFDAAPVGEISDPVGFDPSA
jgi:His-Xaa-Ser system protein HxsD